MLYQVEYHKYDKDENDIIIGNEEFIAEKGTSESILIDIVKTDYSYGEDYDYAEVLDENGGVVAIVENN